MKGKQENVTHVAMYIGEGEFIHSAGYRDRVSINSMDSTRENYIERYPEIFVRSVRILGEEACWFQSHLRKRILQGNYQSLRMKTGRRTFHQERGSGLPGRHAPLIRLCLHRLHLQSRGTGG